MTLGELKLQLLEIDPAMDDQEVVMSRDGEGNGYSPLAAIGLAFYAPTSTYSGELYDPEDVDSEDAEWLPDNAAKAVFLWPTN